MPLPNPVPGLVIRYNFLWHREAIVGRVEGAKHRPCAVVMAVSNDDGEKIVTVLPITHSVPTSSDMAVEIPAATRRRLGLDDERSWVIVTEANRFTWPSPDIGLASPGDLASAAYGLLPAGVFRQVRATLLQAIRLRRLQSVRRSD